jgi:dihydroorotate dehydrogenase (fumarate)
MDLTTRYLGLELRNPLIASAGPRTGTYDGIMRLAEAGVGAVVLPSLFQEDLWGGEPLDPGKYLSLIARSSSSAGIPVIASLNGVSPGSWTDYATSFPDAGAAAVELNIYYLPDITFPARDAEQRCIETFTTVRAVVKAPLAVKLGPYFSSFGQMATRLDNLGADGLVLFNRFMQTDVDPETLRMSGGLCLSQPAEGVLPRSWISRLHGRVSCSLAGTSGVDTAHDIAAYLLAGADAVMSTSALLRHGPEYAAELLSALNAWGERKGFASVTEFRGMVSDTSGRAIGGRASYLLSMDLKDRYPS